MRPIPADCWRWPVPIRLLAGCTGKHIGVEVPLRSMASLATQASAGAIRRINRQTALPIRANLARPHAGAGARRDRARRTRRPCRRVAAGAPASRSRLATQCCSIPYRTGAGVRGDVRDVRIADLSSGHPHHLRVPGVRRALLFWLTGTTFSIMASIGILILMGA
jgi:HAE1 family hydrophobic/amphiphilic exporter-1